jgi:predicted ATPase with chaperone activity
MSNRTQASANTAGIADLNLGRLQKLAPRPSMLADTGLNESFVSDLIAKHLLDGGVLTLGEISNRIALSGPIVREVMDFMREEARIEVRGVSVDGTAGNLRYALTDRGRVSAQDALLRSGYIGPAPVPLDQYVRTAKSQTVHGTQVNAERMKEAFAGVVLRDGIRDQIGPALNSGRAIFIYGPAGTGKTYITQQLVNLFPDETLIPYAISINETVVEVFDPVIHRQIDLGLANPNIMLGSGHDPRYACCERPAVISGGELTADMLEVHYDASTRRYQAPLQLKANNGVFIIDDMGRQRVAPETVFNRWIVPMEEKVDYLSLGAGQHFSVPFDVVLIFSTNLHPTDIADEAFLRRIGYKIEFPTLQVREYQQIWRDFCDAADITCEGDVFDYVVHELHTDNQVPLLPCHPRDLLSIAADMSVYEGNSRLVNKANIRKAWSNYFVLAKSDGSVWHNKPSADGGYKS